MFFFAFIFFLLKKFVFLFVFFLHLLYFLLKILVRKYVAKLCSYNIVYTQLTNIIKILHNPSLSICTALYRRVARARPGHGPQIRDAL